MRSGRYLPRCGTGLTAEFSMKGVSLLRTTGVMAHAVTPQSRSAEPDDGPLLLSLPPAFVLVYKQVAPKGLPDRLDRHTPRVSWPTP